MIYWALVIPVVIVSFIGTIYNAKVYDAPFLLLYLIPLAVAMFVSVGYVRIYYLGLSPGLLVTSFRFSYFWTIAIIGITSWGMVHLHQRRLRNATNTS